jgi:two-component system response regulator AtoC
MKMDNGIITQNEEMMRILSRLRAIAETDGAVLLIGETGVGKELLAEFVHANSRRKDKPFVKVGLAALPRELLESELFGHERGAYTHAVCQKKGLFELSDGGSIFLDDIDDFPLDLQPKLLRALESHEILRVGGTTPIPIDSRLITATKVDLKSMVDRGTFRADLYYRINVIPVAIPPLRERSDDIPLLVFHFARRYAPDKKLVFAPGACNVILNYYWPGNIRELRNVIQRLCLFAKDSVEVADLPPEIRSHNPREALLRSCSHCMAEEGMALEEVMECLERNLIRHALDEAGGNQSQAARSLKLSLSTLRDKLRKYNLPPAC